MAEDDVSRIFQLCPQRARRPDFILYAKLAESLDLLGYLILSLCRVHRAGHKKNEAFDIFPLPVGQMFQKLIGGLPYFVRLKVLIALALADLANIGPFAPRYQIYSALELPFGPVDFARADALLALEEVTAELLKRIRLELVKWDWLAWVEAEWHRRSGTSM